MLKMLETSHPTTTRIAKPPKGFKCVKGLRWAHMVDEPQFAKTHGKVKGAKARGLRFERKVQGYLDQLDGWEGMPGVWFHFEDSHGARYAQADWIGINPAQGKLCIAEIKLTRVAKAWWQLNRLYKPLVDKVLPRWDVVLLEVTESVKAVSIPEDVKIVADLNRATPGCTSLMRLPYVG